MQVNHARGQLAILRRSGWLVLVFAIAAWRVVECPMLHVALSALHYGATNTVPALAIGGGVGLREMQVLRWHDQLGTNAIEAKFAVRALERKRMRHRHFFAIKKPFIHAPEVGGLDRKT